MKPEVPPNSRCGLETVEVSRIEKLLAETPPANLGKFFTPIELQDAGTGTGRAAGLAACFAVKEACAKLFPRETALGTIGPQDFGVQRDASGAPGIVPSVEAETVMNRHRIAGFRMSLARTDSSASATVWADPKKTTVPWLGKLLYHLLPLRRRVVLENLRRVFGEVVPEDEIRRMAQAYYAHYATFLGEFARLPFMSAERKQAWVRVENMESPLRAHEKGKGLLLLTGHFGNFEVATVAGIGQFPQYRGLFHFVRRPLKPWLLNEFVTRRFKRAGFGTLSKRGSLDTILDLLSKGAIIVYVFDQYAGRKDGVLVDFLGQPAGTFKALSILAMSTGASVIPASSWREPDGSHVLRFEDPLPVIECEDDGEAIRRNTRAYNAALERMLLRHPEQWIWMHRRWKPWS
jgi:lauroyl/myristoyl acyltransferase/phosphopantetheinyl transferase (holo-ACP synthase)